jgi:hypothetical protein
MWNEVSHAELEAAKQQLNSQREEMLRRHAEELKALEGDQAEIETLHKLIDTFIVKFKPPPAASEFVAPEEKKMNGEEPAKAAQPSLAEVVAPEEKKTNGEEPAEAPPPVAPGKAQWFSRF